MKQLKIESFTKTFCLILPFTIDGYAEYTMNDKAEEYIQEYYKNDKMVYTIVCNCFSSGDAFRIEYDYKKDEKQILKELKEIQKELCKCKYIDK